MRGLLPKERLRGRLDIYVSASERAEIAARAAQAGMGLSVYVRHASLGLKVRAIPSPKNLEFWARLAPLGNNVNTIAHAINGGRVTGVDSAVIDQLAEQIRLLRLDLAGGGA